MDEEKRNKVTVAVVINAVLLVFILVAVLIAQVVQISFLKHRKSTLISELQTLTQQVEVREDFIEKFETDQAIRDVILELKKLGMTQEEILKILIPSEANA